MARSLKVLIAEDNPADAELVLRRLRQAGFEPDWRRVDTEEAYLELLPQGFELVLSDYEMPQFSGLRALTLLKERNLEIPFIIISGTIGEETAVQAMKLGATDYLLKDRLARLGQAIDHALNQASLRRDRQRAEDELRASEERLRIVTDNAHVGLVMVDHGRRYTFSNATYAEMLGLASPAIVGLRVADVLAPLYEDQIRPRLDRAFEGERVAYELRRPTPEKIRHYAVSYEPTKADGAGRQVVVVITDITERKQAEESVRASEERFRQLTESIDEVFWMTDPAKQAMLYISPAYEKIWGRTCESLYRSPLAWAEAIFPEDRERVLAAMEAKQIRGDYDETYRIMRPDGALRWIHDRAFPVHDAAGKVFRVAGVAQDITEKKQLEAQFFRAQRLESIGTLASGIAHDLNNILAPILMSAPLIRRSKSPKDTEKMLATIESSAQRGAHLVRQLLSFGRGVEGEKRALPLPPLIAEMESIAQQIFPKNITVVTEVAPNLRPILGDPTQIHQVLLNLCVNARDAMPDGGMLTIAAENVHLDDNAVASHPGVKTGDYVRLGVTDTGTGMPPEIIDKIFDPFFTTKAPGKGTGLGLATVLGLVKSHGGFLTLHSELGEGTTFLIQLPAMMQAEGTPASAQAGETPMGHGQLVLVVDDEEAVRDTVSVILTQHGYTTLVAKDGVEGTARYAMAGKEVKLVISDLDMPHMDGVTMLNVIRKIDPKVRIVASSGATSGKRMDPRKSELETLGIFTMLDKPYSAAQLLKVVHEALAS